MKKIIITGTPCTGKTALAKKLSRKLNLHYPDVNKIIIKYNISGGYDRKRKTKIVDIDRLNKALIKEINQYEKSIKNNSNKKNNNNKNFKKIKNKSSGIIIDSHLSHYLPRRYVDLCIVTKCSLKTLEKRLKKRRYSKQKIRENLDAEIFDVCLNEAKENKHKTKILDTTKDININKMLKTIKIKPIKNNH